MDSRTRCSRCPDKKERKRADTRSRFEPTFRMRSSPSRIPAADTRRPCPPGSNWCRKLKNVSDINMLLIKYYIIIYYVINKNSEHRARWWVLWCVINEHINIFILLLLLLCIFCILPIFWVPHVSEWDVKALFNRSTVYIAPLPEGAPWRCRLGFEHDTLRLLLLPPHAGTQPIRPTIVVVVIIIIIINKIFFLNV